MNRLLDAVPSGSYLVIAHPTKEVHGEVMEEAVRRWNEDGCLSVQGPCGQRSVRFSRPGCCSVGCQPGVGPRSGSLVERPQPKARTNDLDADKDRRRLRRPGRTAASVRSWSATSTQDRGGRRWGGACRGAQPYLGARAVARRQDDRWGDPPGARPLGLSGSSTPARDGRSLAGAGRGPSVALWAPHARRAPQAASGSGTGSSGGSSSGLTGASASSPSSTRTWRAWRASLRATDRVARLGVKRSLTFP